MSGHVVNFKSFYAQSFYLIALFLHDAAHDFLDGKRPIEAWEKDDPEGKKRTKKQGRSIDRRRGGYKNQKGGLGPINSQTEKMNAEQSINWVKQRISVIPGINNIIANVGNATPYQIAELTKQGGFLESLDATTIKIIENYRLTFDTIEGLGGGLYITGQLLQAIGQREDLNCELGSSCLLNISEIMMSATQNFQVYNGIIASNGNFFLPINNSIQYKLVPGAVDRHAMWCRITIDLSVQAVPLGAAAPSAFWCVEFDNKGNMQQGYTDQHGGQPLANYIVALQSLGSLDLGSKPFLQGFLFRCGIQVLLSTWLRAESVYEGVVNKKNMAAIVGDGGTLSNEIWTQGITGLRHATNSYTTCVVNDLCGVGQNGGGAYKMTGGMSAGVKEKIKVAYAWYIAVGLNAVFAPITKALIDSNVAAQSLTEYTNVLKLLLSEELNLMLPLITSPQSPAEQQATYVSMRQYSGQQDPSSRDAKSKKIKVNKGKIDSQLLNKFKQIVCNTGGESLFGALLQSKSVIDAPENCKYTRPGKKTILGMGEDINGDNGLFRLMSTGNLCNKAVCGNASAGVFQRAGQFFLTASQMQKKFFINNQVSVKSNFIIGANKFCPISSIFDPMPSCSSGVINENGIELGNMDVTIKDIANIAAYRIEVRHQCRNNAAGCNPFQNESTGSHSTSKNNSLGYGTEVVVEDDNGVETHGRIVGLSWQVGEKVEVTGSNGRVDKGEIQSVNGDDTYSINFGANGTHQFPSSQIKSLTKQMEYIFQPDGQPQNVKVPREFIKRMRPLSNTEFVINCNLKIGDEMLMQNNQIYVPASNNWGAGGMFGAANVLRELSVIINNLLNVSGQNRSLKNLVANVRNPGSTMQRREIVSVLFKKGLGDNLQELNGTIFNGGYIGTPMRSQPGILLPNEGRIVLGTDQPSAVRAMFLLMVGEGAINPNALAGYVNSDHQYILATRVVATNDNFNMAALQGNPQQGLGGGKKLRRKTRKRKNKKRKTKKKKRRKQKRSRHRKKRSK
jgi:hypothetical protein